MKLKPCPFCGQEGAGAHWDHGYWSVTCGYRHDGAPGAHCFQGSQTCRNTSSLRCGGQVEKDGSCGLWEDAYEAGE